ncbi:MAG: NmrA family protein, partial [Saprospiraceae bacterium]
KKNKILCWGTPNIKMDFTTTFNTAEFTAYAAMDDTAPRYLHIAGDSLSAHDFEILLSELDKKPYSLLRPGGIGFFNFVIAMTRFFDFKKTTLYPAWQGMQYMRDMMEGRAELNRHDNNRYRMDWTSMKQYLAENR